MVVEVKRNIFMEMPPSIKCNHGCLCDPDTRCDRQCEDECAEIFDDGLMYSTCESCDKQHSYPPDKSKGYYDLCRECAVDLGYEDSDSDWRKE